MPRVIEFTYDVDGEWRHRHNGGGGYDFTRGHPTPFHAALALVLMTHGLQPGQVQALFNAGTTSEGTTYFLLVDETLPPAPTFQPLTTA